MTEEKKVKKTKTTKKKEKKKEIDKYARAGFVQATKSKQVYINLFWLTFAYKYPLMQQMHSVELVQFILKIIRERASELSDQITTGFVEDWNIYQNIVGQLQSLGFVESEIQSLMNRLDGEDG